MWAGGESHNGHPGKMTSARGSSGHFRTVGGSDSRKHERSSGKSRKSIPRWPDVVRTRLKITPRLRSSTTACRGSKTKPRHMRDPKLARMGMGAST